MKRCLLAAVLLTLLAPSVAFAQTTVRLGTATPYGSYTGFGVYVGPYQLQFNPSPFSGLPGQPTVDAFCVDFGHHISSPWQARVTSVSDFPGVTQYTRQGVLVGGVTAQRNYLAAAWLATQMMAVPVSDRSSGATAWKWYHGAIWHIMGAGGNGVLQPGEPFYSQFNPLADKALISDKVSAALTYGYRSMNANDWVVVTPTDFRTNANSSQEFITRNVVPEPATILLLASGLLAIGLVAYLRGNVV